MTPQARLGGFKILKDVVRISIISPTQTEDFPAQLLQTIAEAKINLPYITVINDGRSWRLNIMVDSVHGARTSHLIEQEFGKIFTNAAESVILSIFPHRSDPIITGSLLEVFDQQGIDPDGYANSPSAISAVLKRGMVKKASNALFGPFSFSAYRTPADWKLAQKGKEQLYKEVVASYQEKKPKVYGLEYQVAGVSANRTEKRADGTGGYGCERVGPNRALSHLPSHESQPGKRKREVVYLPTHIREPL